MVYNILDHSYLDKILSYKQRDRNRTIKVNQYCWSLNIFAVFEKKERSLRRITTSENPDTKARFVFSDFQNEDFHNGLLEKSKRMLFPSSASEITIVQYPINFGR